MLPVFSSSVRTNLTTAEELTAKPVIGSLLYVHYPQLTIISHHFLCFSSFLKNYYSMVLVIPFDSAASSDLCLAYIMSAKGRFVVTIIIINAHILKGNNSFSICGF